MPHRIPHRWRYQQPRGVLELTPRRTVAVPRCKTSIVMRRRRYSPPLRAALYPELGRLDVTPPLSSRGSRYRRVLRATETHAR